MLAALPEPVVAVVLLLIAVVGLVVALNVGGTSDGVARRHEEKLERGTGGYITSARQARTAGWLCVTAGLLGVALLLIL